MNHRRQKWLSAIPAACLAAMMSGCILCAFAAYQAVTTISNQVTVPAAFGGKIVEHYIEPEQGVYPGEEITKEVKVENTGTVPELVRVKLDRKLGHKQPDGSFSENTELDPECIQLNTDLSDWTLSEDGYYYYNDVLEPEGETSKLLKSFSLTSGAPNGMQSLDCQIIVTAETMQVGNAAEEVWGVSMDDLGIVYDEGFYDDTETCVVFMGSSKGFDIALSDTDLFANFKGILPGSARSQTIKIENASEDTVEIGLNAMEMGGADVSEEVKAMMMDYASIEIKSQEGETLYDGPVGGQGVCDISFGVFKPKESKNLGVTLSMSPELDTPEQMLSGSVSWQFQASIIKSGNPEGPGENPGNTQKPEDPGENPGNTGTPEDPKDPGTMEKPGDTDSPTAPEQPGDDLSQGIADPANPVLTNPGTTNHNGEPEIVAKQWLVQTSDPGLLRLGILLLVIGMIGYGVIKIQEKRRG